VDAGIEHPRFSYEARFATREQAEKMGRIRLGRAERGMSLTAVHLRERPDGEWIAVERIQP